MNIYCLATVMFTLTALSVCAVIVSACMNLATSPAQRRRYGLVASLLLLAWLGSTAVLAARGALNDFSALPPRVTPVLLVGNLAVIVLAASPIGMRLALCTPVAWLVGYQVFRVGVEVVLALLYHAGVVPMQMTFEGRNWDILVGLTAVPVAWLAARGKLSRTRLLVWNLLSLGLLLNIVVVSVLSMPTPLRAFSEGPANTFIATVPYIWLPALLVPAALGGHLLVFRRAMFKGKTPVQIGVVPNRIGGGVPQHSK